MGIFWLETPFSGVGGNGFFLEMGVFLTPKPSFPDFGVFDPCKGQTDSQDLYLKDVLFFWDVFPQNGVFWNSASNSMPEEILISG